MSRGRALLEELERRRGDARRRFAAHRGSGRRARSVADADVLVQATPSACARRSRADRPLGARAADLVVLEAAYGSAPTRARTARARPRLARRAGTGTPGATGRRRLRCSGPGARRPMRSCGRPRTRTSPLTSRLRMHPFGRRWSAALVEDVRGGAVARRLPRCGRACRRRAAPRRRCDRTRRLFPVESAAPSLSGRFRCRCGCSVRRAPPCGRDAATAAPAIARRLGRASPPSSPGRRCSPSSTRSSTRRARTGAVARCLPRRFGGARPHVTRGQRPRAGAAASGDARPSAASTRVRCWRARSGAGSVCRWHDAACLRRRATRSQARLDIAERRANVARHFGARGRSRPGLASCSSTTS